jgi:mono/diheme cytochrome c family protein
MILRGVGLLLVTFIAIQMVPYGWNHTNPPIIAEPNWDSPRTRELAKVACFDCHSNETIWPWYSNIAPVSWLSANHVDEGRDELNFSEWPADKIDEIVDTVLDGEMPTWDYKLLHPEARLSDPDIRALADGLRATLAR